MFFFLSFNLNQVISYPPNLLTYSPHGTNRPLLTYGYHPVFSPRHQAMSPFRFHENVRFHEMSASNEEVIIAAIDKFLFLRPSPASSLDVLKTFCNSTS